MELIDIVDENNQLTGQVEDRWVAYNKGLWRRTVSCWIINKKGEILLQKRVATKKRNPNKIYFKYFIFPTLLLLYNYNNINFYFLPYKKELIKVF